MNLAPPAPTLAAVTTGPGPGALGVIEVCGPGASAAVAAIFRAARPGADPASGRLVRGTLADGREPIDDALVCFRPAAAGWLGEDAFEIHCHGGPVLLDAALDALARAGVRRVTPRDLAFRAVRNGRLDAVQAEALLALAGARTPLAARVLLDQFRGALSRAIARLDALPPGDPARAAGLRALLDTAGFGLALASPPRVVLAGAPNAGKSTLFNALLGADRAITDPSPGTTRDPVDDLAAPGGVPLRLVDTAGLADGPLACDLEAAGRTATERALAGAAAVLIVADVSVPVPDATCRLAARAAPPRAWVWNKADLLAGDRRPPPSPAESAPFLVSALDGRGVGALAAALPALAGLPPAPAPGAPCVFTILQREVLTEALAGRPTGAGGMSARLREGDAPYE